MECTIITPVGPGHQTIAQDAIASVQLAARADRGPFERIHHIFGDDIKGKRGRSEVRNACVLGREEWMALFTVGDMPDGGLGICETPLDDLGPWEAEWLFFLDADDMLCGPNTYGKSAFAVVEPYLEEYDCVWGAIYELHSGKIFRRKQVDRITTYKAYVKTPAPLSCQMGHFVRRNAFLEVGGFNEKLDVCEDVDLYLREWRDLRCIKQEKPLFLNRRGAHSWMNKEKIEGAKPTFTGRDWSIRAEEMLKEARKSL